MATKKCTKCGEEKPLSEFYRRKNRASGYHSHCTGCHKRYNTQDAVKQRRSALKLRSYGLTPATYAQMVRNQHGGCAICGQPETWKQSGTCCRLSVDHNHTTGAIRGLLCRNCNTAIGLLRDNAQLCKAASAYLDRH